jgi:hypothetical protein
MYGRGASWGRSNNIFLKDTELKKCFKRNVKLLKAFTKAHILDDVTGTGLYKSKPTKGVLMLTPKTTRLVRRLVGHF